ncbi:hypothetical protein KC338_g327 [Hortaea werneckii]|nr:hypothetical protein KC338_g327 [Hortaea werneckii]
MLHGLSSARVTASADLVEGSGRGGKYEALRTCNHLLVSDVVHVLKTQLGSICISPVSGKSEIWDSTALGIPQWYSF